VRARRNKGSVVSKTLNLHVTPLLSFPSNVFFFLPFIFLVHDLSSGVGLGSAWAALEAEAELVRLEWNVADGLVLKHIHHHLNAAARWMDEWVCQVVGFCTRHMCGEGRWKGRTNSKATCSM
jgi:hypothetical protein